jgi:transcriptional regulator with XRE-family HTH domain
MKKEKRAKLEKAGWKVGSAADFLGLSPAEEAFVELKLGLARCLRDHRTARDLSQAEVARRLGSSQSRVAKMEAADATVTLDLLVRALLTLGASPTRLARAITAPKAHHPADALAVGETSPSYDTRRKASTRTRSAKAPPLRKK